MSFLQRNIGLIGLGVMGQSLALNIEDHGFSIVGFDKDAEKVEALKKKASSPKLSATKDLKEFIDSLEKPRTILFLVPAGAAVDAIISELSPFLSPGDLIIDGGNSHFQDTLRREKDLESKNLYYLGMGISGGESGARRGPSLMPGGSIEVFNRVKLILEAIAAKSENTPCVAHLGSGASGHFVKMVHNGIEYALMQLIAESYDLMKRGLCLSSNEIQSIFSQWEKSETSSYLIQITRDIFLKKNIDGKEALVEFISDCARQKGTGKWTVDIAMDLQVPTPTIDVAVTMRNLSRFQKDRKQLSETFLSQPSVSKEEKNSFLETLHDAFYATMILTFDQGMKLIRQASDTYKFETPMEKVAQVWRGGCIIRAALLSNIAKAYEANPSLIHLISDAAISKMLNEKIKALRKVVQFSATSGFPIPAFMASLGYFDSMRSAQLPSNLIQAQRDYFGAHKYERVDQPGIFHHTEWV